MSGETFPLENDASILEIDSPRENIGGPYAVVYKDLEDRWAIVALSWDGEPRLGIRWFWGGGGNPFSSAHPTWLVIPPSLSRGILASLPPPHVFHRRVDDFLAGIISGDTLQRERQPNQ